jgi:hypothetical protein
MLVRRATLPKRRAQRTLTHIVIVSAYDLLPIYHSMARGSDHLVVRPSQPPSSFPPFIESLSVRFTTFVPPSIQHTIIFLAN